MAFLLQYHRKSGFCGVGSEDLERRVEGGGLEFPLPLHEQKAATPQVATHGEPSYARF